MLEVIFEIFSIVGAIIGLVLIFMLAWYPKNRWINCAVLLYIIATLGTMVIAIIISL